MKELAKAVAEQHELTEAKALEIVRGIFDAIGDRLAREGKLRLGGFGTFELRHRKERTGRNPRTGDKIIIPASVNAGFKAGHELRARIEQAKSGATPPTPPAPSPEPPPPPVAPAPGAAPPA